jgi:leader peptidase (prepilin peptidase)/N-methyltransferase
LTAAFATGAVVASVPTRGPNALPPLALSALAVWGVALAILALIDHESLVVPTKLVRAAVLAAMALLALGSLGTGDWRYLWQGAACAAVAGGCFGAWSALNPRGLGFGDARMALLVALGAGALSPPGSLAALACSPLAAGLVGRHRFRNDPGTGQVAVALGPFLAIGGLAVVVAHAY